MKAWLRDLVYGACEHVWALGFVVMGFVHRAHVVRWSPLKHGRICVIAPHPDDECTGCGGTIVQHARAGDHVTVVQVTDGRAAHASREDADAMAWLRAREAQAATAALGVCLEPLGLREYDWSEAALCAALRTRLARLNPDVVYAPSCIDFHPEHLRVARALAAALHSARPDLPIRVYAISVPLTPALVNCVCDTSAAMDAQDAALAAYRSQSVALLPVKRLRHYWARYFGFVSSAEVFWELRARDYRALMQHGDWLGVREWTPALVPYRNVRARPFTDPLAFWQGKEQRRKLRKMVEKPM